jgi:hypothetical protein
VSARPQSLVVRPPDALGIDDKKLQQLWIATQKRTWRSLAILGAAEGIPTLGTANLLARISWSYSGTPSAVFDLRDVSLRLLEHQLQNVQLQIQNGERVFIALRSIGENPTAIALARAADAVLLAVSLGKTKMRIAKKAVEDVGRERFLGSIIVDPAEKA